MAPRDVSTRARQSVLSVAPSSVLLELAEGHAAPHVRWCGSGVAAAFIDFAAVTSVKGINLIEHRQTTPR
jgi:hypothetical protein